MTTNQNVVFSSTDKPEFITELKSKVNDYFEKNKLSKYGNASIVLKSILMILIYFAPYVLMLTGVISSFFGILACWLIMGFGMAGLGMVLMHDASHGTFSKNRKRNNYLSKSLYLLGGFPPNWKQQHNVMHHGFTNIDGHDEDIAPIGLLRFSPHKPLQKIHRFQRWYAWFFYGLMTLSWVTAKDFKQLARYKKANIKLSSQKKYSGLMVELLMAKLLYYIIFLVAPLILLSIAWYWIILFFLAMHFVGGFILSIIFQSAHVMPTSVYPLPDESGNIENSWAIHQLFTTSDFAPKSRIFSWMIGGLNYQVEHHLFPNISHVHYKNIASLVKTTAQKYNLPYHVQPTFMVAFHNHFKMLKLLGQ